MQTNSATTASEACAFVHKSTGKERDAESGLDYFGARYFESILGRFSSPDDGSDQDVGEPQSWNLYSYTRNTPLNAVDPNGRDVKICPSPGNSGQQLDAPCTTISNNQYAAAQKGNNGSLNVPSLDTVGMNGDGNGQFNSTAITDSSGNVVGTATYESDGGADYYANRNGMSFLVNQTSPVVNAMGWAAMGSVAVPGVIAAFPEAGLITLGDLGGLSDVSQVIAKAGSTIGNQSMNVANQGIAEQAAKEWVGDGARTIYGRSGQVAGEISADGTKVARITSAATKNYINLEDKLTGSNLHVRW